MMIIMKCFKNNNRNIYRQMTAGITHRSPRCSHFYNARPVVFLSAENAQIKN